MTVDELNGSLPKAYKGKASQAMIDAFNERLDDSIKEDVQEKLVSLNNLLLEGKYSVEYYMDCVAYVSYKMSGYTNQDAWAKVFPERYKALTDAKKSPKDISSHVSNFHNRTLVGKIMAQAMLPAYITNAHHYQTAINALVKVITTSEKPRDIIEASGTLMTHLKPPETKKIELNVGVNTSSALEDLRMATAKLAEQQEQMIKSKMYTARDAAHQMIIEGEYEEA